MTVKIIDHPTLSDFLSTVASNADDNVRLNLLFGILVEVWSKEACGASQTKTRSSKPDSETRLFVTLWEGNSLRLLFAKLGAGPSRLASPLPPSQLDALAVPHLPMLVSHLLSLPIFSTSTPAGPSLLRTLAGPLPLVLPFLSIWPHPAPSKPSYDKHVCSLRIAPPLASCTLPKRHSISLVDPSQLPARDLDRVGHLVNEFLSSHPASHTWTIEQARDKVKSAMTRMWVYRAPLLDHDDDEDPKQEPVPVGFVMLGRPTPDTIGIKGVMVDPRVRGRGIAERMVSKVVRTFLVDANPLERDFAFEGTPPRPDPETIYGRKKEVCLFVDANGGIARRLYKRIGFEESEDVWGEFNLDGVEPGAF